jgi:hypothetical protein
MNDDAIEIVGPERAALAAFLPVGTQHEVIDDELAAAGEEIGERLRAIGPLKDISLLDLHPGHMAAPGAQFVTGAGEGLFLGQERLARRQPFVLRYDCGLGHGASSRAQMIINHSIECQLLG